jgi:hypothetical protein
MLKYLVFSVGLMVWGSIGLAGAANAATPLPPVIRPSATTKQMPVCYIESTQSGFRNLDAACLMGKGPELAALDMVTDRDQDGVPDDLVPFFRQMDRLSLIGSSRSSPQAEQAMVEQFQKNMNNFAQRAPLSPATKADIQEFGKMMGGFAQMTSRYSPNNRSSQSPQADAQFQAQFQAQSLKMGQIMQRLSKDPVMQQVNAYASRYQQNKYEKLQGSR